MSEQNPLSSLLSTQREAAQAQATGESIVVLAKQIVAPDLDVESVKVPRNPRKDPIELVGTLLKPSYEAFGRWRKAFNQKGFTPFLEPDGAGVRGQVGDPVVLKVIPGSVPLTRSNPLINLVLFVVTLLSTLFVGALYSPEQIDEGAGIIELMVQILTTPELLLGGFAFAGPLLAILAAHEFGHYFAARSHRVNVTLPYFIPMPFGFGTLGAFIRLKEPVPDRRRLFDIGVAGPLAGLVLAVPLLFIGLSTSPVQVPDTTEVMLLEGNSLLYYFAKIWVLGQPLPDPVTGLDVMMNRVTFAAWIGLLVTALNLLPLGQLDGGHTVFALFGKRARLANITTLVGMALLGVAGLESVQQVVPQLESVGWTGWFVWMILITLLGGPFHPPALDDVTHLDAKRRWLGYFVILVFVVTFVPVPLRPIYPM